MRHSLKSILASAALFLCTGLSAQTVNIDPSLKQQKIEGWGVSLCWWANKCGEWNKMTLWRTSETENHSHLGHTTIASNELLVTLPAKSITTFEFE